MPKYFFKRCAFFVMVLIFLFPCNLYASMDLATTDPDTRLFTPDTRASNPECAEAAEITKLAIAGLFGGVGGMIASLVAPPPLNVILLYGGMAAIGAGIVYSGVWLACAFSFVRHPVMRYEIDGPGWGVGDYRECRDPVPNFPQSCNKTFRDEKEYFKCIDKAFGGVGDPDRGQTKEPRCRKGRYVKTNNYVWPKNRDKSSTFIEVCYRNPLGAAYVLSTGGLGILGNLGGSLEPREEDYGDDILHKFKTLFNGDISCHKFRSDENDLIHGVMFNARQASNGRICARAVGLGYAVWPVKPVIGCHLKSSGLPAPKCRSAQAIKSPAGNISSYDESSCQSCYISGACAGGAGAHTLAPLPVTSTLVECLKESLSAMLTGCTDPGTGNVEQGFLGSAQEKLKRVVNSILALACMLMAVKAIIGGVQQPQSEIIMFLVKLSMVVYLTNGDAMGRYYDSIIELSMGLSDIILDGAGNVTVCDYKPSDYAHGAGGKSYSYLAAWDRLDCRMAFYMGGELTGETAGTLLVLLFSAGLIVVALLLGSSYILINVISLFATIMFILVVMWILYLFILSMISITILILLSPIFLPMMLFQVTKNFYDSWIKELMTYTIYPVMLFAFLAFMFSVYDSLYFNGLEFERDPGTVGSTSINRIWYKLKTTDASGGVLDQCSMIKHQSTLACVLSTYQIKKRTWILGIELTDMEFSEGATAGLWVRLVITGMLGFLFYHFLNTLGSLAAELAGNPRGDLSRGVKSPGQMMQGVLGAASSVRGKIRDVASKGLNAARGGDKEGGKGGKEGKESVSSGSAKARGSSAKE